MKEDLLTGIQRQLEERMAHLHGAVDERDRLQVELATLEAEQRALDTQRNDTTAPGSPLDIGVKRPPVESDSPLDIGRPSAPNDRRPRPKRAPVGRPVVSPKVARLMLAPVRPSLQRSGL